MTAPSAQQHVEWLNLLATCELQDAECQLRSSRGDMLDVLLTLRLAQSNLDLFAVGGLVDVTACRRAENTLRQSQKIEALGQLTGGVAHHFNNSLAAVMGDLDLLRKRVPDDPGRRHASRMLLWVWAGTLH
jgi:signal transduction histidine kinase